MNDYWKYLHTAIEEYKEFPAWNKPKEFYELLNKFCNESKKFTESSPIGDNAPKNPHAGETKIGTTFDGEFWAHKNFPPVKDDTVDEFVDCVKELAARLAAYEDTGLEPEDMKRAFNEDAILKLAGQALGMSPDRLRELAQAYRLLGNTVYEPNKRGFVSTYKVISVHLSECSILIGWNLLDGIYSNLNGFEISALGKTVFLTREAAEAALEERKGNNGN